MKGRFFLGILLTVFCLRLFGQDQGKMTQVKGQLTDNKAFTEIFLKVPTKDSPVVTSAKIGSDGSFSLDFPIITGSLYKLWLAENNQIVMIIDPGDKIIVKTSAANMGDNPVITGSPQTMNLLVTGKKIDRFQASEDSINKFYQANLTNPKIDSILAVLRASYDNLEKQKKAVLVSYLVDHPSIGGLLYIDKVDINEEFPVYDQFDKAIYSRYSDNQFIKDFHNKVESERRLAIGSSAPELKYPAPDGQEVSLSSLRGKIVLVDFWASWCGPCRRENPHVVETYKKYHDKGFEVYGVSLDKNRDSWLKAIQDDGLVWTQVSDLKYWQSEAAKLYGVTSIPCTFLIDKDGKLIGKNLRGESLDQKMQKLFGY